MTDRERGGESEPHWGTGGRGRGKRGRSADEDDDSAGAVTSINANSTSATSGSTPTTSISPLNASLTGTLPLNAVGHLGQVNADAVIDLVFYEHSFADAEYMHTCAPDFTHQVFEHERIDFLSCPQQARISINVCTSDLSTFVGFHECVTYDERQKLLALLGKTLPSDYGVLDTYAPVMPTPPGNNGLQPHKLRRTQSDPFQAKLNGQTSSLKPPGTCIHSFSVVTNAQTRKTEHYEVYLATAQDKGAAKLLARAEKLAIWFIETADGIDFSDDRWEALFLYHVVPISASTVQSAQKHNYYFAGYFTLFTFRNVIAGFKMRICQALILPSHQQRGLGKEMILSTYRLAQSREEYKEVTVEDPAPGFEKLRDICDCDWAVYNYEQWSTQQTSENTKSNVNFLSTVANTRSLSTVSLDSTSTDGSLGLGLGFGASAVETTDGKLFNSDAALCARILKITPAQAAFAMDAVRYCYLPENRNHVLLEQHQAYVDYRNDVKKRLLRENPDLKTIEKDKKFKKLEEMFQELSERFKLVRKHHLKMKKARAASLKFIPI
jgi:hypothetical protein